MGEKTHGSKKMYSELGRHWGQYEGLSFGPCLSQEASEKPAQGKKPGSRGIGGRTQILLLPQVAVAAHKEVQGPDVLSSKKLRLLRLLRDLF